MSRLLYSYLPNSPGVYLFKDRSDKIIYVGKANNLKSRVSSYFRKNVTLLPKTAVLVSQIKKISYIKVQSELEALLLEANLIKKYYPKYNFALKDNKAYPYIKITVKEDFPRVLMARIIEKDKALYFGPYPDNKTVRFILKITRRIFPYCDCKNPLRQKSCFYEHLGLCPHPKLPADKTNYRKNIRQICLFLMGRKNLILKNLIKEMEILSFKEKYEKANLLKNKIDKIKLYTTPVIKPFEYELNPNLLFDIRNKELRELSKNLAINNYLHRIECYDISNTKGLQATGSLVVFENGEKNPREYKKFKIKNKTTPDDPAMIYEILLRRLKHKEWPFPDLIVIDGGEIQLKSAVLAIAFYKLNIPVVSLAKRLEEIHLINNKTLLLGKGAPSLNLLMRLRDEAHRFAKKYHLLLRSKKLLVP